MAAGVEKREQWSKKIDFLFACVGYSVGLGNVWRFPFLCYRNGGGAFLLPYFTAVILGGVPVFFLEVSLGQFMSESGIGHWRIAPLFQGIGYASMMLVFLMIIEYNIIMSWAFRYLFASFTSELPWSHCGNSWNTPNCTVFDMTDVSSTNLSYETAQVTMSATADVYSNTSVVGYLINSTTEDATASNNVSKTVESDVRPDAVTEFWERGVLGLSAGIEDLGSLKWELALCLLLSWTVVYFCICKGIKSSGKVMYFTATAPYVFLIILMIRGLTLDGVSKGLKYYLNPDFSRLSDIQVWVDAGNQIFFSYATSMGVLTVLGSFNKYHHNCFRDVMIFSCINTMTSILSGFVIFPVLGFMAHRQNMTVADVAESGPGLAFIAYPTAVAQMPLAPVWSAIFFIMIILVGLDSQFVCVEGFITACVDLYPQFLRRKYRKEIFTALVCVVCCILGLPMVAEGGMYVFQLFDYYSAGRMLLVIAAIECLVVAYVYGVDRFSDNLVMMLGFEDDKFVRTFKTVAKIFWKFLTPAFALTVFTLGCVQYSELSYKRKTTTYEYPGWAIVIGWFLSCLSLVLIPIFMVQRICTTSGTLRERLRKLTMARLKRHQLRPNEDMSRTVLLEGTQEEEGQDLQEKITML